MATTKPTIFDKYYSKGKISDKISKIKVDQDKMSANLEYYGANIENYVDNIYTTYNINHYKDKEEFIKDMKEHSLLPEDKYDDLWKKYQHRDELIRSGQYEELRVQQYRDAYIQGMKNNGFSDVEIYNVSKLSLQDFKRMSEGINFDKTNPNKNYLPQLGELFAYGSGQLDQVHFNPNLPEYQENLRKAFDDASIPFIDNNEEIQGIRNKKNKRVFIQRITKLIPKRERVFISKDPVQQEEDVEMFTTSDRLTFKNKKDIIRKFPTTHKYAGEYFIPGLGSTVSKNPEVASYVRKIANEWIKKGWL